MSAPGAKEALRNALPMSFRLSLGRHRAVPRETPPHNVEGGRIAAALCGGIENASDTACTMEHENRALKAHAQTRTTLNAAATSWRHQISQARFTSIPPRTLKNFHDDNAVRQHPTTQAHFLEPRELGKQKGMRDLERPYALLNKLQDGTVTLKSNKPVISHHIGARNSSLLPMMYQTPIKLGSHNAAKLKKHA